MISMLVVSLLAAEPCDIDDSAGITLEQRETYCALTHAQHFTATLDRGLLTEIYLRPDFAKARQRNPSAFAVWQLRLFEWLESLLQTTGAESYYSGTRAIVLGVAAVIAVLLGLRFIRRRAKPTRSVSNDVSALRAPLKLQAPTAHLEAAHGLLASNPRGALRETLLALLSLMERERLARIDRVKTNRELIAELPQRGATAEATAKVGELLRWYDRAFYSLEAVEVPAAKHFISQVEALTTTPLRSAS